jgi:hypothetical protein
MLHSSVDRYFGNRLHFETQIKRSVVSFNFGFCLPNIFVFPESSEINENIAMTSARDCKLGVLESILQSITQ